MNTQQRHGPGPIVHGPSLTDPTRYIVELPDSSGPQLMTRDEIAAIPIRHQWFSGTQTGLLCTWWSRDVAEQHGQQLGCIVGQIKPMRVGELERIVKAEDEQIILVLCDTNGQPLQGA